MWKGGLHEVWKDDAVLECRGNPDQIQGVVVERDLFGKLSRIVAAQETTAIGVDADAEISNSYF